MDRRKLLGIGGAAAALAACPLCHAALAAEKAAHWGYDPEDGPGKWGRMDPAFAACGSGREQSPVNLEHPTHASLGDLDLDWQPSPLHIVHNGHTIQVAAAEGSSLKLDGETYALKQFHFHHPSEHSLAGQPFPMEVHFVHAGPKDFAVVGVFMQAGAENPTIASIWQHMPHGVGETRADTPIDPSTLLPAGRGYWRYEGSLTTPPCSEQVNWLVLAQPIEVSQAQLTAFAKMFPNNARPVQDRYRRFLLSSF